MGLKLDVYYREAKFVKTYYLFHIYTVHALPASESTHKDLDKTQVEASYRELKEKEEHLLHHVMRTAY